MNKKVVNANKSVPQTGQENGAEHPANEVMNPKQNDLPPEVTITKDNTAIVKAFSVRLSPDPVLDPDSSIRKGDLNNLPQIHPEFAGLLPEDTETYYALKEMILMENAITTPITTCIVEGIEYVLDGHRRYDIAVRDKITNFTIKKLTHITTVKDGICWIIRNACTYRKLNKAQRVQLVRQLKDKLKDIAKENQKIGGREKKAFSETEKADKVTHVDKELAKLAGTSPDFYRDADYIFENGNPAEKKQLLEKGTGASAIRKKIEKRNEHEHPKPEIIAYANPNEGLYIDQILCGDSTIVMKDMHFNGIKDVACVITNITGNEGINYGPDFSDSLPREEYLENIAQAIYQSQLLGRDGMKICINCNDTRNRDAAKEVGDYQFDIGKDLCNKIDQLNRKYDDCNLRYMGRFIWFKDYSNTMLCPMTHGSSIDRVIPNNAEYIMIWCKNTSRLANLSGINCDPGSGSIFSNAERDKYIITKAEYNIWTQQTWQIHPCTDEELLKIHPDPLPEEIPYRLIKLFSAPNDIVINPFMGVGTSCKVANDLKRRYVGIDQFSNYCVATQELILKSTKQDTPTIDDINDAENYHLVK